MSAHVFHQKNGYGLIISEVSAIFVQKQPKKFKSIHAKKLGMLTNEEVIGSLREKRVTGGADGIEFTTKNLKYSST